MGIGAVLGLLGSPVTKWIAIGVVIIAGLAWVRHDAATDATAEARAECLANAQEAADAERARLARAAAATLAEARDARAAAEDANAKLKEQADALLARIDKAGAGCSVPDDLMRELRAIK